MKITFEVEVTINPFMSNLDTDDLEALQETLSIMLLLWKQEHQRSGVEAVRLIRREGAPLVATERSKSLVAGTDLASAVSALSDDLRAVTAWLDHQAEGWRHYAPTPVWRCSGHPLDD